ncbi:MAG: CapA family protein [Chloroflexi bacterium]|nr:CapA family protein [Chloroflexota bacterium]
MTCGAGQVTAAAPYYLAVAAPFPTVADGVAFADVQAFWAGDAGALARATNDGSAPTLFVTIATQKHLAALLGPQAKNARVKIVAPGELASAVWAAQPSALAIVPFDELEPRLKVLTVDGIQLFDKQADVSAYPLKASAPATNRDTNKMTVVAMTGVTALVRGTAVMMEKKGLTYPGEKIRDWLKTADITHISNEVSFWDKCPRPTFNDGVTMCSDLRYLELLKYVGTDIIELTGNHLWDRGWQQLNTTLDTYDSLGWVYFGGGRNAATALDPVRYDIQGNKIAFVGCNWFGNDWATDEKPGSARCGSKSPRDLDLIIPLIQQLKSEGYHVIVGIQYAEYYQYDPKPGQVDDFNALRAAGADVVNGSQGHHAAGFAVNEQGFMHYGVGNLFFGDQAGDGPKQSMVDRHVFYNGRYLGVDVKTAFIRDFSQPQPMTPKERAALLRTLFAASGW